MGGAGGQTGDQDRLADADAHQRQAVVFIGQHGIDHAGQMVLDAGADLMLQ